MLAVGFLGLAALVFHSDRTVRARFASARWVQPAQVYSAPQELYTGAPLSTADLAKSLQRLGYRLVGNSPEQPGEYLQSAASTTVYRRGFQVGGEVEPPKQLVLQHTRSSIRSVTDAQGQSIPLERLEPERIGSLFPTQGEDRLLLRLEDWPQQLKQGLLAVEDRRFYEHAGVDPQGLARAMLRNLRAGRVVEGGSTLTQQLVKNLFLTNKRSYTRKAREAIMALLLEWHFDKNALLEAYGNEVYLGQDGARAIHGFGLGSQYWFGKPLQELTTAELALLVGMVKGPSAYNPVRNPDKARERRNVVLRVWLAAGLLDAQELAKSEAAPLGVASNSRQRQTTTAFIDLVRRELQRDFASDSLTYGGLRIYTHLDPYLQAAAEASVAKVLPELQARGGNALQAALVATSVADGRIRALVGSAQPGQTGFNRALDARRPIGSLIKPVVYTTALSQPKRYSLVSPLQDERLRWELPNGDVWEPQNFDEEVHGQVPLYLALAKSYNLATVALARDLGIPRIAQTLRDLGVREAIPVVPSLSLGVLELSPLDVARMYNTLAAGGYPSPLRAIAGVYTADGEALLRDELRLERGLDRRTSFLLHWAMQRTVIEGTARSLPRYWPNAPTLAGKTGTSDGQRDAWFSGFGADLQATVWVGRDDNQSMALTGASGALPVWAQFMAKAGPRPLPLRPPPGVAMHTVDQDSYLPAEQGCRTLLAIPFVEGSVPDEAAPCARSQRSRWFRRFFD